MKRLSVLLCAPLLLASLAPWFLSGCVNPETGRRQLLLLSSSEEMTLGLNSFEEMKKEVPISTGPGANAMVQRVGKRIASVAELPDAKWEFVVFESKEANAFCLPGGKIGVYTGILPIVKDDAGLAAVLGHEVAHATLHHGNERLSRAMVTQAGGEVVNSALSSADPRWRAASTTVYGLGIQLGEALPHSRKQESEADHIGLRYMARAGYDPDAAVAFWERFAEYNKQGGSGTPWFLRTHPLDETRIKQLKAWMPEAQGVYQKAK